MTRRGRIVTTVVAGAAAMVLAVPALAATPREIARDYADNGRLDKAYSRADMERALNNALLQEYERQDQGGLESAINERISQQGIASARRVSALPFTGVDLALMAFGGGLLLLLGAGLRRAARKKARA